MVQPTITERQDYSEQFDVEELAFFRRLLAAIQNKEFVVYFQPKVSINDMQIAGAEALVRWEHDGQLLAPASFIPFCERTGLVVDVDFLVLEETCRRMRHWIDSGIDLVRVSVNFSKYHFNQTGVAERIYEVVGRYGIPTQYLEVEFTETAYLDRLEIMESTVDKLRSYGIKSSIDDFGSGYSSFNLLQNMDFEVVKLDKSLLGKGVDDIRTKKVISNIINMAKELDMEVLAEGVETKEELRFLKDMNCDIVQGFLFDKPLPADEFEARLKERSYLCTKNKLQVKRSQMKLEDIENIDDLEKEAKRKRAEMPEPSLRENHYMDIVGGKYVKEKKYTGILVTGLLLTLFALTVLVITVLWNLKENRLNNNENRVEEITYTQTQVDGMIESEVAKAKEETREAVDLEYKTKIHEAAEVAGGTANFLRSLFPDEMVFVDGYRYRFVPINRELKMSTIEAARFVTDEQTGFMYYTDANGQNTSYIGIDVSSFQRDIDWDAVKASGVEFVIIRCGIRGYGSDGNLVADSYFTKNIEGAKRVDLPVGVYFYTQALNEEEAVEEAEFALSLIEPYEVTGPVVLDVEQASSEERIRNITATQRTDNIIAFCNRIKSAGYDPYVYADVKYFTMRMEIERLEDYKKWYANYNGLSIGEEQSIWGYNNPFMFPYEFSMWQYSNSGKLEGISGAVDFDVLFEKWW